MMPGSTKQSNFGHNRTSGRFFPQTTKSMGDENNFLSSQKKFDFDKFTKTSIWKQNAAKAQIVNINKIVNTVRDFLWHWLYNRGF